MWLLHGGACVRLHPVGHAWLLWGGKVHGSLRGGMRGCSLGGPYMVAPGGAHNDG